MKADPKLTQAVVRGFQGWERAMVQLRDAFMSLARGFEGTHLTQHKTK